MQEKEKFEVITNFLNLLSNKKNLKLQIKEICFHNIEQFFQKGVIQWNN